MSTAESWLNNSSDNANRGKALSVYMIVQMFGIVSAQALLAMGDASGYALFILSSGFGFNFFCADLAVHFPNASL